MEIRWSPEAAEDLVPIGHRIQLEKPNVARTVVFSIYTAAEGLTVFPNRGRTGRIEGTRELVLPSLP